MKKNISLQVVGDQGQGKGEKKTGERALWVENQRVKEPTGSQRTMRPQHWLAFSVVQTLNLPLLVPKPQEPLDQLWLADLAVSTVWEVGVGIFM